MRKTKFVILISMVLISGFVLTTLWLKLQEKKVPKKEDGLPKISTEGADMRLEKIRFVEDKHGQRTWELEAKQIQQYQDQNLMMLEDVKVTYYSTDGRVFIVSGKEGKYYQDSKNLALVGNVILTLKKSKKGTIAKYIVPMVEANHLTLIRLDETEKCNITFAIAP